MPPRPKAAALPAGTLDLIRQADDTNKAGVVIDVPEWGCSVRIRGLTRGEVRLMGDMTPEEADVNGLHLALLEPTVTIDEATELLTDKSFGVCSRILEEILVLSGLTPGFRSPAAD